MQFGNKTPQTAQTFGSKSTNSLQYGAKHVANGLKKVNSIAVPVLALSGMGAVGAGLKASEALARGISKM